MIGPSVRIFTSSLNLEILVDLGITKENKFVEVQRADLVSNVIGGTVKLTKEKIEKARNGVLFVDEAYQLATGVEKDFGTEAIDTIMSIMLSCDSSAPVCIFAGYPDDMNRFLQSIESWFGEKNQ